MIQCGKNWYYIILDFGVQGHSGMLILLQLELAVPPTDFSGRGCLGSGVWSRSRVEKETKPGPVNMLPLLQLEQAVLST